MSAERRAVGDIETLHQITRFEADLVSAAGANDAKPAPATLPIVSAATIGALEDYAMRTTFPVSAASRAGARAVDEDW